MVSHWTKRIFVWIGLLLVAGMGLPVRSTAYTAPAFPVQEKAREMESEHFRFVYQEPLAEAVPRIAAYFEEAYRDLTPIFNWEPAGRTTVLLQDGYDTHNGWATTIPQNIMSLYIAGPTPGTSIFQHGNYIRRTIYHELTHLITMDMRMGYSKWLSMIFGRVVPTDLASMGLFLFTAPPTALAPRWFLEGVAIWSETEFCPPGRGRSTYADMLFRCAVRDDELLPYSQWYLEIPRWPYGDGAYLYGMKFFQYLHENTDKKNPVGKEIRNLANSFLFNLDAPTSDATGKAAWALAEEMLEQEKADQQEKLAHLRSYTPTECKRLTPREISAYHPVYGTDRIFFLGMEPEERDTLYAYHFKTRQTERLTRTRSTAVYGSLTISSDNRYLYYTVLELQDSENLWSELRRYDLITGRDTAVYSRGRYVAVDLAPDGRRIAAVSQRSGRSSLILLSLNEDGEATGEAVLHTTGLFEILSNPRFSPDGSRIAYTETDAGGYALKVYNLKNRQVITIWSSEKQILTPAWHPKKNVLLFSSDLNGVYNLYRIDARKGAGPAALSHVTGGLISPVVSKDTQEIAAIGFDADGPYLTTLPYPAIGFAVSALPEIGPSWQDKQPPHFGQAAPGRTGLDKTVGKQPSLSQPAAYNSLLNIRPDYWSPWAGADANGVRSGIGGSVSDPTGYQSLQLSAGYAFEYETFLGSFHYTYSGILPQIHLYGGLDQQDYPELLIDRFTEDRFDYTEDILGGGIAMEFPFLKVDRQILLLTGYEFTRPKAVDEAEDPYRNRILAVYPTELDAADLWARLIYFDGTAFKSSSSMEDGRYISLAGSVADEGLGSEYSLKRITTEWREYISMPWLDNHVLLVSGFFGYGYGDHFAQGYYGLGGSQETTLFAGESFGISRTQGLRGYSQNYQVGDRIVKAAASYRFPILHFFKGYGNRFPSYFQQLHGEVYYEGGRTWDPDRLGDTLKWLNAVGTEVNLSMTLLRYLQFAPGLGVVWAPDVRSDDEDRNEVGVYISLKGWASF